VFWVLVLVSDKVSILVLRVEPVSDEKFRNALVTVDVTRLLVVTELKVSTLVHVRALLAPEVNTWFVGTSVERVDAMGEPNT
jgi:hypothetical protein